MSNESGIIVCGVCKNVVSTLPVIRAAFEDLAAKAGVPCWAIFADRLPATLKTTQPADDGRTEN
jgi:hypothetical protein